MNEDVSSVVSAFRGLSPSLRLPVLALLMDELSPEDRLAWHSAAASFLHRDFVAALPSELAALVLGFLDTASLFRARAVSTAWKARVQQLALWKRHAHIVAATPPASGGDCPLAWMGEVGFAMRQRMRLSNGTATKNDIVDNLVRTSGHFGPIDVSSGILAAASSENVSGHCEEEEVTLFSIAARSVVQRVTRSVSNSTDVVRASVCRLLHPAYVAVGYMDGHITCWKLGTKDNFVLRGHTAAVFTIDADQSTDLLVSGSADYTVRLWSLATQRLLRTVSSHGAQWVVSVAVHLWADATWLLSMSKSAIHVLSWTRPEDLPTASCRLEIPLKSNEGYDELRDVFFTPGLHFQDGRVTFVRQMPLFDTQTIGDADIITVDIRSGMVCRKIHINQKIRKLLAVGRRFALVLMPFVDSKYRNLAVIDLLDKRIIGGCTVAHSRATTPDFSQLAMGDAEWLNGFGKAHAGGLVLGLGIHDGTVHLVEWT